MHSPINVLSRYCIVHTLISDTRDVYNCTVKCEYDAFGGQEMVNGTSWTHDMFNVERCNPKNLRLRLSE